jgi:hypothetical protein
LFLAGKVAGLFSCFLEEEIRVALGVELWVAEVGFGGNLDFLKLVEFWWLRVGLTLFAVQGKGASFWSEGLMLLVFQQYFMA